MSYCLNGATPDARIAANERLPGKQYYFIPSEDEWYKAAYYSQATSSYYDFPTSSDMAPGQDIADDILLDAVSAKPIHFVCKGGAIQLVLPPLSVTVLRVKPASP